MRERSLFKFGSVSAIAGAILGFATNFLHPRTSDIANPEAYLREVAESAIWIGDHVGILFAALLALGGYAAIYRSFTTERGTAWARLGSMGALLGAAIISVLMATDGIAAKVVAGEWMNAPAAEKAVAFRVGVALAQVNFSLFSVTIVVWFGVTNILYGLAILTDDVYPRWLGWVAVIGGGASVLVGLNQAYTGLSVLTTNILFPIVSTVLILWFLVMGVVLWRRAGAAG